MSIKQKKRKPHPCDINLATELKRLEVVHDNQIKHFTIGQGQADKMNGLAFQSGENIVTPRRVGLEMLDRPICPWTVLEDNVPFFYAWSDSHIYFIEAYDGDIEIRFLPRNPVYCAPKIGGRSS